VAASAIGTGMLARSVTNKPARRLVGLGNGHGPDDASLDEFGQGSTDIPSDVPFDDFGGKDPTI
jgi:hypothetical protein